LASTLIRKVMENKAKGCEVIISGKLTGQRAKAFKLKDGVIISSGQPVREFMDEAVRYALTGKGVLGIKVRIMKPDNMGKLRIVTPMPDHSLVD